MYHYRFFIFACILFSILSFRTDPGYFEGISVRIEDESFIIINGKTNINTFRCTYTQAITPKTFDLSVSNTKSGIVLEDASLDLGVIYFDCGNNMMNKDLQKLLKSGEYPHSSITFKCVKIDEASHPADDQQVSTVLVETCLNIAGTEKSFMVPIAVRRRTGKNICDGSIQLNIKDYGLEVPKKMWGMVVVEEMIEIDFQLVLSIIE